MSCLAAEVELIEASGLCRQLVCAFWRRSECRECWVPGLSASVSCSPAVLELDWFVVSTIYLYNIRYYKVI